MQYIKRINSKILYRQQTIQIKSSKTVKQIVQAVKTIKCSIACNEPIVTLQTTIINVNH